MQKEFGFSNQVAEFLPVDEQLLKSIRRVKKKIYATKRR
jgi:hypothetical protein